MVIKLHVMYLEPYFPKTQCTKEILCYKDVKHNFGRTWYMIKWYKLETILITKYTVQSSANLSLIKLCIPYAVQAMNSDPPSTHTHTCILLPLCLRASNVIGALPPPTG